MVKRLIVDHHPLLASLYFGVLVDIKSLASPARITRLDEVCLIRSKASPDAFNLLIPLPTHPSSPTIRD